MVQKSRRPDGGSGVAQPEADAPKAGAKRRGRPRGYVPDVALGRALDLFRKDGLGATSLDDLSSATGMNRPSLYGAFGDKRALYLKSYLRYRADARAALIEIFQADIPIRERLTRIFSGALDIYFSGEDGPRGCFTVMTATSEAVADPEIRDALQGGLVELDKALAACFRGAIAKGELPANADPESLAQLASAMMHSLAIRARARIPREQLETMAAAAIDQLCGPAR